VLGSSEEFHLQILRSYRHSDFQGRDNQGPPSRPIAVPYTLNCNQSSRETRFVRTPDRSRRQWFCRPCSFTEAPGSQAPGAPSLVEQCFAWHRPDRNAYVVDRKLWISKSQDAARIVSGEDYGDRSFRRHGDYSSNRDSGTSRPMSFPDDRLSLVCR
jgi:hypothetical protein